MKSSFIYNKCNEDTSFLVMLCCSEIGPSVSKGQAVLIFMVKQLKNSSCKGRYGV